MNGAVCSASGVSLDGTDDYVNITPWRFGGATSFEVYVKYDSFNSNSRVLGFSSGQASDNVILHNQGTTSTIRSYVNQGSTGKYLDKSYFDSATWTHVVVTVSGANMKTYKNGVLVGTKTDGHEPNVMTRTNHIIGISDWVIGISDWGFDGTIASVKMGHGVEARRKLPDLPPALTTISRLPHLSPSFFPSQPRAAHRLRRHLPVRSP